MRLSLTTITWLLALLIAMVVSVWSIFLSDVSTLPRSPSHSSAPIFDAYMETVSATILNRLGKPSMHIEAPRMTHFPESDTTQIIKPFVTLYRKISEPWYIHAEHGAAMKGTEKIVLTTRVFVHHPADRMDPEMRLVTESLTIFPDAEEVNTADAVTLTQPDATVHAIGMNANFNTGIVHLLSDTRSEYVPAS